MRGNGRVQLTPTTLLDYTSDIIRTIYDNKDISGSNGLCGWNAQAVNDSVFSQGTGNREQYKTTELIIKYD